MVNFHFDIEQKSPDWFAVRKGKLTGSNATAIGAYGAGLETYTNKIALELIGVEANSYTSAEMDRGIELEPLAISAYEFETNTVIQECGFITNDKYPYVGVSPDGLIINQKGGIEIKCRNNDKHFSLLMGKESEIPKNQIQMCLLITEFDYWDFVSFNTNFKNPIFITRIYPDLKYFEKLKIGFEKGIDQVFKKVDAYNNLVYPSIKRSIGNNQSK